MKLGVINVNNLYHDPPMAKPVVNLIWRLIQHFEVASQAPLHDRAQGLDPGMRYLGARLPPLLSDALCVPWYSIGH